MLRGLTPRQSCDEARNSLQSEAQDILRRTRRGQMHPDHRLHFDDAGGDLDEAQAQGVELSYTPHRALRHRDAKPPRQLVGPGVEEQQKLIGRRFRAGCAICRKARLPGLDVIFGVAAPAIEVFVEPARVALPEIGDDEARIGAVLADCGR